jgi:hypothetical protein
LIFFAYAPTSYASETLKSEFEDALSTTINCGTVRDVLVIYADANASLGQNEATRHTDITYASIGSHDINYVNVAGRRLRSFLELNDLASLSTFFKKKYRGT